MSECGAWLSGLFLILFPEFSDFLKSSPAYFNIFILNLKLFFQPYHPVWDPGSFRQGWLVTSASATTETSLSLGYALKLHCSCKSLEHVMLLPLGQLDSLSCSLISNISLTEYEFNLIRKSGHGKKTWGHFSMLSGVEAWRRIIMSSDATVVASLSDCEV